MRADGRPATRASGRRAGLDSGPAAPVTRDGQPDRAAVELDRLEIEQCLEFREPLGFRSFLNLLRQSGSRGAWARAILEREGLSEPDLADQVKCGGEILVGLARKPTMKSERARDRDAYRAGDR